ncbi:MAG: fused MFS/spermidine synthase [Deltaproteobacteria bacterium]|nr:fused MFS/spermidine synthase [Deltaproteobacteria bacterium]
MDALRRHLTRVKNVFRWIVERTAAYPKYTAVMSPWQTHNLVAIERRLAPILQTRPGILFEQQSPHNHIVVRRTADQLLLCYRHTRHRLEEIQSRLSVSEPLALKSEYTQAMLVTLAWQPAPQRVLLIGLGGGRLQMVLHHYLEATTLHTIELDPLVVEVAQRFFGFATDERQQIVVGDGRTSLQTLSSEAPFDVILLDAYHVSGVPSHLSTREFYDECCAALAPTGVVAANLQSGTPLYDAERKTFAAAFPSTMVIPLLAGNVVVIGFNTDRSETSDLQTHAAAVQKRYGFDFALPEWAEAAARPAPYRANALLLQDADLAKTH